MNDQWIPIQNWVPVVGMWSVEGSSITYRGPQQQVKPYLFNVRLPHGICASDVWFEQGKVRVEMECHPSGEAEDTSDQIDGRIVLGYRSPRHPYLVVGIGGYEFAYTMTVFQPERGWTAFAVAGSKHSLASGRKYFIEVSVAGQRIKLSVDGVQVLDDISPLPVLSGQLGLFSWERGETIFHNPQIKLELANAFVVMQFSEPFLKLFADVIKPVAKSVGLEAYHIGEKFGPGFILEDIQRSIIEAKVIIADVTPSNENVFYELGYAHALRKPTILLAERGKKLPFDTSPYRHLFYDDSIGGKKEVEEALKKHLEAILNE